MKQIIINGLIVTPDRVFKGNLTVENGRISCVEEISDKSRANNEYCHSYQPYDAIITDADGHYVLPGLIDLHCDMLEQAVQPRKNVYFPVQLALQSLQTQYLSSGITSMLHPVSFSGEPGIRSNLRGRDIVHEIEKFRKNESTRLRHFIHIRYEISNKTGLETVDRLLDEGLADLFSIMDHSPSYTRFGNIEQYKEYIAKNSTMCGNELMTYVNEQWNNINVTDTEFMEKVLSLFGKKGVIYATHDDNCSERFDQYRWHGATISEFPLNEETAAYVTENNCYSVVGAPNLYRNGSHAGNMSAGDAIGKGIANIICSDYYCFSLLPSVFLLHDKGMKLEEAVSLVSHNPAKALGWSECFGSLQKDLEADIIIVKYEKGRNPIVKGAMVAGQWTYRS